MRRTIVIGDVHGCSRELENLLNAIRLQADDRIVFLGDLVNRGPDTPGVLKLVRELPYETTLVLGNHERRLLRYQKSNDAGLLKPYDKPTIAAMTAADWELLHTMKLYVFKKKLNTLLIHGGLLPGRPWKGQAANVVTRIQVVDKKGRSFKRSECPDGTPWAQLWDGPPFVVYGHTPSRDLIYDKWALGIDTGCVYGGKLTAYILPEKQIVQVPARQVYVNTKSSL